MIINAALALPAVIAVLLLLARRRLDGITAAWLGSFAMLAMLLFVIFGRRDSVDWRWIEPLGSRWVLGMDDISWPFALMTAFLGLLCCLWLIKRDTQATLVGLVVATSVACLGVFVAGDLLVFFVFFELALIPMWFVIAWWGDPDDAAGRRAAATRFLLFTVTGSALLLVGIVVVALRAGSLAMTDVQGTSSLLAATLILLGLAVKVPLVPAHTWLPDAHSKAPTVGSVLLAGVFLKLGTYGLLRLDVMLLPESTMVLAPALAVVGAVGIAWATSACFAQTDLKRLIAWSSVGHMGFAALALATMNQIGVAAVVFVSVAHGLITGLLFFVSGAIKERYGSTSYAAIGRGLYDRAPRLTVTFAFAAIASMGLPGLAGFWGELLALRSVYEAAFGDVLGRGLAWTALGAALIGVALTIAYFTRAIRRIAQGVPTPDTADQDLAVREMIVCGALAVAILVLGVAPGLLANLGVSA